MIKKQLISTGLLLLSIFCAFLLSSSQLKNYDLQLSALLFIILFISRKFFLSNSTTKIIEAIIFTFVILILVNNTGRLNSPFFFLIYFLLFALSLLLSPIISVITTLNLIVYFFLTLPPQPDFKNYLTLLSLAFLTPFAMYLGKEYLDLQQERKKNQISQQETYLFLSLVIKNHLKNMQEAVDNFMGDKQLEIIKKNLIRIEKLIKKFENTH
jgi:hypothetical protein